MSNATEDVPRRACLFMIILQPRIPGVHVQRHEFLIEDCYCSEHLYREDAKIEEKDELGVAFT